MSRHTDALNSYKTRLLDRLANLDSPMAEQLRTVKLDWFRIENNIEEESEETDVFIYDDIGGSFGVEASTFVEQLNQITAKTINLRINCRGGSVFDAIAIYNSLVKHPAYVRSYVDSLAASAASFLALAGDEVIMMEGSQMMIHDALGMEHGNSRDMQAMSTFLNRQSDNIASLYANRAGGSVQDWRAKMLDETWMFADEAVEMKLADKVYVRPRKESEEIEEESEAELTNSLPEAEDIDISQLMQIRHTLSNCGFKYAGRQNAPKPQPSNSENVKSLRALLRK